MKVMFLDESGDHSLVKIDQQFPVFCLAGCIFDDAVFTQTCNAKIDALKLTHFGTTDVILHSRDIRKRISPFNILMDKSVRGKFYGDINHTITDLPFMIIASGIRKSFLKQQYSDPANPYELSLMFIMERFLLHLEECNDVGYISAESRDPKSNTDLVNAFTEIMNNGSGWNTSSDITADRYQKRIQKIEFITKKQNNNGHQVADLVAYPIARYVLEPTKSNPAFDILKPKIRASKTGRIEGYGLKIFPTMKGGARVLPVPA